MRASSQRSYTHPTWPPGGAQRVWLDCSLARLDERLRALGSRLIVRHGPSLAALRALIAESGAEAVLWNRCYEPAAIARDKRVKAALRKDGIRVASYNAALLCEPWTIETRAGGPYKVFTPFWKALSAKPIAAPRHARPQTLPAVWSRIGSQTLDSLRLLPTVRWDRSIRASWTPGESGAQAALESFLAGAARKYEEARDRPGAAGTSRLSPHLHFGELGPRQVWHAVQHWRDEGRRRGVDMAAERYLAELGWREFAYHLLYHFPDTPQRPLDRRFERFPWRDDPRALRAWQRGDTGVPLVDAGMRELWRTGWMHNRVRMVVASFLTKNLLIPWQAGAAWFWDTLVDADLANNTLGWQWTAGCGADAAPFFRIFNPARQGERFDPAGEYVRRWVPEIAALSDKHIHAPWRAPADALRRAGVEIGWDYPQPLVDLVSSRERALLSFKKIKGK